ncbi:MAG TPA: DUF2779 domain-containing protein [Thermoleophilia bacterium]|nr:DUF2779 domain-containing protein [Thermoleophilia bacterium]
MPPAHTSRRPPRLSKSRFQTGLQCYKKLWLKCFEPSLADPIDEVQQAIFDQGHRVGDLARERYPGGVLVAEDYRHTAAALAKTAELIASGASCLYEAAFEYDGVLVRADVIVRRLDGSWELVEVKSTSKAKLEHHTDVAIQLYVLEGAGLSVAAAGVLHLDTSYVYAGGAYDLIELYSLADVTERARAILPNIPGLLADMKAMLSSDCPDVRVGKHCTQPYDCDFRGYCHSHLPEFPVTGLPRIGDALLDALLADGILSMRDVPPDYPGLTDAQAAACELVRDGRPHFAAGLVEQLGALGQPLNFLDFETVASALPLYAGTRPYQALPVQWSCHTLHADGALEHREFLHEERSDPRRSFALSLPAGLPPQGRVVVYSSYENTVLTSLSGDLPDLSARIADIQDRLFDLLPLVRRHVRHPDILGHASLKYVLPALVDDLSYDDLAVQNGAVAGLRYAAALADGFPEAERRQLFADLRAYCATDTLALVRLFQTLKAQD